MRREEQTTALWHGEETLEPREYEKAIPPGSIRYTVKQDDHWDWVAFRAYGRHDLYYIILDVNGLDPTVLPQPGMNIIIPAI